VDHPAGHLHLVVTELRTPRPRDGELDWGRTEWTRVVRTFAEAAAAVAELQRVVGALLLADDGRRHRLAQARDFRGESVGQWSDHHAGFVTAWADVVTQGPVEEVEDVPPVAGMELDGYRTTRVGYVVTRVRLVECAGPPCPHVDGTTRGTGSPPHVDGTTRGTGAPPHVPPGSEPARTPRPDRAG
jgi:hypothetical protein